MTIHQPLTTGKYLLRFEDYRLLDEAGTFGDARTELIGGEIIVMSPEYRPHSWPKDELHYRLRRALEEAGSPLHVASGSILVSDNDVPLPDVVVTAEPRGQGAIPLASVALVVEVSSTTLNHDMKRKVALYAAAGIPEYWVADVNARVIHQMWAPAGEAYAEQREVAFGERIAAATIDGLALETAGL